MYAIKGTSFRAVSSSSQAAADETVVDVVPQSLLDAIAAQEALAISTDGTLRANAEQALTDLRTFRDLASPTNAQTLVAVKLLCRVAIGLIRMRLAKLDAAD
ncbi:hypothetical protein [Lysobacter fragariae]